MPTATKVAKEVAKAYGAAFTKAMVEGDMSFQTLFVADEHVLVVLQNQEGNEVPFTVGEQEDATLNWKELIDLCSKDLAEQDFLKSESQCLGILGDRMIMETARLNKAGEVYLEAFSLVTLNDDGKIIMLESFSDVNATTLVEVVG